MNARMAGYSGTPLAQKLGIKADATVLLVGAPKNYRSLVSPLPTGVRFLTSAAASVDILHLFVKTKVDLEQISKLKTKIFPAGSLWVSWPKKNSHLSSKLSENSIREAALDAGLVDVKVCAVDETWSGLKLVFRKTDRRIP